MGMSIDDERQQQAAVPRQGMLTAASAWTVRAITIKPVKSQMKCRCRFKAIQP
jgi:hypothetical protein